MALVAAVLLTACSAGPATIRVSAAASVADAVEELAVTFEESSGIEVDVNVGGSTTLVEQVVRGAPVDVLLTADERTMRRAVDAEVVTAPAVVASNRMVVAWPADGPTRTIDDLGDHDLLVGLCAPEVPCGATARAALADLGIRAAPDTEDGDVRTLLARLAAGELDIGVVYATDLSATNGDVAGTDLPGASSAVLAATTTTATAAAADFVELLRSPAGAAILRDHGFVVEEAG